MTLNVSLATCNDHGVFGVIKVTTIHCFVADLQDFDDATLI